MQTLPHSTLSETTEVMLRNICQEMAQIEQAMISCRGDALGEPRLTGA